MLSYILTMLSMVVHRGMKGMGNAERPYDCGALQFICKNILQYLLFSKPVPTTNKALDYQYLYFCPKISLRLCV